MSTGLKSAKSEDNNCRLEDFTDPAVIFTPEDVYYQWRTTKDAAIGSKEDGGVDLILGKFAHSLSAYLEPPGLTDAGRCHRRDGHQRHRRVPGPVE